MLCFAISIWRSSNVLLLFRKKNLRVLSMQFFFTMDGVMEFLCCTINGNWVLYLHARAEGFWNVNKLAQKVSFACKFACTESQLPTVRIVKFLAIMERPYNMTTYFVCILYNMNIAKHLNIWHALLSIWWTDSNHTCGPTLCSMTLRFNIVIISI